VAESDTPRLMDAAGLYLLYDESWGESPVKEKRNEKV
jgi:hypothetical protein